MRASTVAAAVFALSGDADSGDDFDDGDFDDRARFADPELDGLTARYDAALRERGMVDVDELVTRPVELLSSDASLAACYQERWTDVFVDEYQDVDEQQYLMLRQLAAPGARICAIGDPDQAIYGFRGGDVGYFLRFQEDFGAAGHGGASTQGTGAITVRLSRSYRSAPTIVRAAMQLIRPGTLVPGRELIPARTDIPDGPVALHAVGDEWEEAEAVAAEVERLLGGASFHALDSRTVDGRDRTEHQLSFADFAVLYRTSSQAAAVGEALARRGFPVQRRAHSRLAEMPGVAAILAADPHAPSSRRLAPCAWRTPRRADSVDRSGGCCGASGSCGDSALRPPSARRPSWPSGPRPMCSARLRRGAAPTWTGSSTSSRSAPRWTPGTRAPTGSRC